MKEFVIPAARSALRKIPLDHPDRSEIQELIYKYGEVDLGLSKWEEREEFARETGKILAGYLSQFSADSSLSEIIPRRYPQVRKDYYENFLATLSNRQKQLISMGLHSILRVSLTQAEAISNLTDPGSLEIELIQTASDVSRFVQNKHIPGMGKSTLLMLKVGFEQFEIKTNEE